MVTRREVLCSGCCAAVAAACVGPSPTSLDLALADYPELGAPGGQTYVDAGALGTVIVVRVDDTAFFATSAICTHAGCSVTWSDSTQILACPCHGSQFAEDGSVLRGPADTPLASYPVAFDGTTVTVDLTG